MGTEGQAWCDLGVVGWPSGPLSFDDVRRLDVDAARLCDGFEYHYHRGGRLTWFCRSSHEELVFLDAGCLPPGGGWHLPGCACTACRACRGRAGGSAEPERDGRAAT
jgi:hypothetical protein